MRIACDIDGVILDFVGGFLRIVNEHYKTKISHQEITEHGLDLILGIGKDKTRFFVDEAITKADLDQIPGAFLGIAELVNVGNEVIFLTNRDRKHKEATEKNLDAHGYFREWLNEPLLRQRSGRVAYADLLCKRDICIEEKIDVAIDDSTKEALALVGTVGKVILLSQPWNRGCLNLEGKFIRCDNWKEIVNAIK